MTTAETCTNAQWAIKAKNLTTQVLSDESNMLSEESKEALRQLHLIHNKSKAQDLKHIQSRQELELEIAAAKGRIEEACSRVKLPPKQSGHNYPEFHQCCCDKYRAHLSQTAGAAPNGY